MGRIKRDHQYQTLKRLHNAIDGKCYLCMCDLDENDMTKDHVFPKTLGYTITRNMMPAHKKCNLEKGDRLPTVEEIEFACNVYDSIYLTFSPRTIPESKIFTKPIEHFINLLAA